MPLEAFSFFCHSIKYNIRIAKQISLGFYYENMDPLIHLHYLLGNFTRATEHMPQELQGRKGQFQPGLSLCSCFLTCNSFTWIIITNIHVC